MKPTIRITELASRLGAEVSGDCNRTFSRVDPLNEATEESLSWLGHVKYQPQLAATRAAAVLVKPGVESPPHLTTVRVADPDVALITALELLAPPIEHPPVGIHVTAVVDASAQVHGAAIGPHCTVGARAEIGPGTVVHAGAHVGHDTRIGRDCIIWNNAVIRERCRIGDRVVIHPNATIGADGFGYLFRNGRHVHIPQIGTVEIADDVEIGAGTCVDRARSGVTRIGQGTKIDNQVQIGHNCTIGEHCVIVAQTGVSGSTTLGRFVTLAGAVGVVDHVAIGDGVQVAAMAGITADVEPGRAIRGNPAVDMTQFARQHAAVRRLPKLIEQVRELAKRIERLEATHDRS